PYFIELQDPGSTEILLTADYGPSGEWPVVGELYPADTSLQPDGRTRVIGYTRPIGQGGVAYVALGHCHNPAIRAGRAPDPPEPGLLARLPNLKLIVGLGAGVDHLLRDPELPRHIPIMRLVDPYMTDAMSEFVVLSVLRLHRQDLDYLAQQRAGEWRELEQKN